MRKEKVELKKSEYLEGLEDITEDPQRVLERIEKTKELWSKMNEEWQEKINAHNGNWIEAGLVASSPPALGVKAESELRGAKIERHIGNVIQGEFVPCSFEECDFYWLYNEDGSKELWVRNQAGGFERREIRES